MKTMCINFLDLIITRKQTNLETDTYRKPTTIDTTINFLSKHLIEHKMAAFRYHISRTYSQPLAPGKKQKEWELIQLIARNNDFPQNLLQKLNQQINTKPALSKPKKDIKKKRGQHSPTIALK